MDMQDFVTFLENFNLILVGISNLVGAAEADPGTPYLWSPLSPDTIEPGTLEAVYNGFFIEGDDSVTSYALDMLSEDNPVLCLLYNKMEHSYILQAGK